MELDTFDLYCIFGREELEDCSNAYLRSLYELNDVSIGSDLSSYSDLLSSGLVLKDNQFRFKL